LGTAAYVRENIALTKLDEGKLGVIGVSRVVFQAVGGGSKESESLIEVWSASARASTEIDAAA
jgi:hypothetical protein